MRVSLHDLFILVEIANSTDPFWFRGAFASDWCILLLPLLLLSSSLLPLLLLLHSFSFYIVFLVIVQLTFRVCVCVIHFKIMRKNILAVSAVCFHISQIYVFFFPILFLFCSSRVSEQCVSDFVISACCWFLSETSLCDQCFFFVFVWCDSKFFIDCEILSNKPIYSGKSMCFCYFLYFL